MLQVEDITVRIEASGSNREPDTLVVERNGGFGRDLRGNAQVEVAIRPDIPGWMEREVFTASGLEGPASGIRLDGRIRRLLRSQLSATVTMDYVVRHILTGDETSEDGDDRVQFIRLRTGPTDVRLRGASPLYGLVAQTRQADDFLRVVEPGRSAFGDALCVTGRLQAEQIKTRLEGSRISSLGGHRIGFIEGGRLVPLSPANELLVMSGCGGSPTENETWGQSKPENGT